MSRIIGVNSLYIAKLLTDNEEGATWEAPVRIPSVISLDITDNKEDVTFYSDDAVEQVLPAFSGSEVAIELGYLTNELEAIITGNTYKDGMFMQNSDAIAENYALLFKAPKSKGGERYVCLYKGVLSRSEENYAGKGESIESSNVNLTGVFMPLDYNHNTKFKIDTDDEKLTEAGKTLVKNWFTTVPMPDMSASTSSSSVKVEVKAKEKTVK